MIKYKKSRKIIMNIFNNISELYNFIEKTPRRTTAGRSSETGDSDFTGTNSLEEAYNLLLKGDDELYRDFKNENKLNIEKILGNVINRKKLKNDIVGFQPNIPNYLLGLPDNMINTTPNKVSQKIINIVLSMSVSAGVDKDKIKKIGIVYTQVIDLLEKGGYRCNLYLAHSGQDSGEKNYCLVKIKTDREPFNVKKTVFPIAHPSMFRRIMFKWMEVCDADNEFTNWGYGRPIENKGEIKKDIDKVLKGNFIVWNFQNEDYRKVSPESVLKDLKEKYGIKLGE